MMYNILMLYCWLFCMQVPDEDKIVIEGIEEELETLIKVKDLNQPREQTAFRAECGANNYMEKMDKGVNK